MQQRRRCIAQYENGYQKQRSQFSYCVVEHRVKLGGIKFFNDFSHPL
jgi:hypothetical protein